MSSGQCSRCCWSATWWWRCCSRSGFDEQRGCGCARGCRVGGGAGGGVPAAGGLHGRGLRQRPASAGGTRLLRLVRVDPNADQRWTAYLLSLLGFSAASVLGLYLLQRVQPGLPLSLGRLGVPPAQAFNTAASF